MSWNLWGWLNDMNTLKPAGLDMSFMEVNYVSIIKKRKEK